ncbi:MAG: cell wall hydrolase [Oscillospiraceae bacterium]|nr:cell wall hydrolase [Oscillospiraceae bacterium]
MKKHLFTAVVIILVLAMALSFPAAAANEDIDMTAEGAAAEATAEPEEAAETADEPVETAEEAEESAEPAPRGLRIVVNGIDTDLPAMLIDSTTYVPLRAFSMALGAKSVIWHPDTASAEIDTGKYTVEAILGDIEITANGRHFYAPTGNRLVNGVFMVPIRPFASAFGADVLWAGEIATVYVTCSGTGIKSGDEYYDQDDLYWLAHIINAEARGEPFEGKLAVGNVVMNRVKTDYYPNSVYGVVFDGYQFSPAFDGSIYYEPNFDSWRAAKLVLEGAVVIPECLFFAAAYLNCWATYNRDYCTTIGGHAFYY